MAEERSLTGLDSYDTALGRVSLAEHTAPLDRFATNVCGLRTVMVNLYAVCETDGNWVLVDTGLPGSEHKIEDWISTHVFREKPYAIVLTHGHFDHVGAVAELSKRWDVPVYAHRRELPFLTGQSDYPKPDATVGGGLMSLLAPFYPKRPINLGSRVQALPEDNTVPGLPSWRWLHTPGHTPGHISLFRESDRTLLAGDAVITTKQEAMSAILTQRSELHGPPAYFTNDWDAAEASVKLLAQLRPQVIASGHGKPVVGVAAAEALELFASRFRELGVPAHGHYVNH